MSKILIAALLGVFAIFSNCNPKPPGPPRALSDTMTVKVQFSGLMAFLKESSKPGYAVGILVPIERPENKHQLLVKLDGKEQPFSNLGEWTLEITNSQPTSDPLPASVGHCHQRLQDDLRGQYDFDWIIDFQGPEFHNIENMPVEVSGLLKPIIHLPVGQFSTEYKSMDLQRWKGTSSGSGSDPDFGFVAETIALELILGKDQELVLKDGAGDKIFTLPFTPGHPRIVEIKNIRGELVEASDFLLYYQLFPSVDPKDRFDFRMNGDALHPPRMPFNPYPVSRTCCHMACSAILLKTGPLK